MQNQKDSGSGLAFVPPSQVSKYCPWESRWEFVSVLKNGQDRLCPCRTIRIVGLRHWRTFADNSSDVSRPEAFLMTKIWKPTNMQPKDTIWMEQRPPAALWNSGLTSALSGIYCKYNILCTYIYNIHIIFIYSTLEWTRCRQTKARMTTTYLPQAERTESTADSQEAFKLTKILDAIKDQKAPKIDPMIPWCYAAGPIVNSAETYGLDSFRCPATCWTSTLTRFLSTSPWRKSWTTSSRSSKRPSLLVHDVSSYCRSEDVGGEHSASVLNLHIGISVLQDKLILTDQQLDFLKQGLSKLNGQEPLVDPQPFFFSCSRGHRPSIISINQTPINCWPFCPGHPGADPHSSSRTLARLPTHGAMAAAGLAMEPQQTPSWYRQKEPKGDGKNMAESDVSIK